MICTTSYIFNTFYSLCIVHTLVEWDQSSSATCELLLNHAKTNVEGTASAMKGNS